MDVLSRSCNYFEREGEGWVLVLCLLNKHICSKTCLLQFDILRIGVVSPIVHLLLSRPNRPEAFSRST